MNESISILLPESHPPVQKRIGSSRIWFEFKCFLVDRIKSAALANLQKSKWGEILILKHYLRAEELAASNGSFSLDEILKNAPEWLCKELRIHEKEEAGHVRIFETRIQHISPSNLEIPLYLFSNRKIETFHSLILKFENRFTSGAVVPALVVALTLENMGVRIFKRHLKVLKRIDGESPTGSLLRTIIRDEKRHVRGFLKFLRRLVKPSEFRDYVKLRKEALALDHKGGLISAIAMFVLSILPIRFLFVRKH
ncbi:ferritin-like domain-containing protein [Leptospira barantonii]|uniref:Ferritin-like domain-containing protein n=1 Tax=Leptospira barantonii TaxID=2023184 RepID=A0ABX4NQL5_9LEPT|nr:ferritin-like domain-containing protein [Leptospira barantonii]PJZ57273.1 hypothetical protein CH367_11115 [Leptospira barantonii]